jgi:hypothetical protein
MSRPLCPRSLRHESSSTVEHWDHGFESYTRHGCLCAFILFVLSCVGSGLATGCSPVHGVLSTVYHSLTHSLMELSRSCEAANCAATQELRSVLWNPKVHYRVRKSPPLVPILSQIDPFPTVPSYLSKFHFIIVHPPTSWSSQWSRLCIGLRN